LTLSILPQIKNSRCLSSFSTTFLTDFVELTKAARVLKLSLAELHAEYRMRRSDENSLSCGNI